MSCPPPSCARLIADPLGSVRTKIKNFEDNDHYFAKGYYARCLYLEENDDRRTSVPASLKVLCSLSRGILIQPLEFHADLSYRRINISSLLHPQLSEMWMRSVNQVQGEGS